MDKKLLFKLLTSTKRYSHGLTHQQLKNLFIQKTMAIENGDFKFLSELRIQHPELFDKKFLYDMLQTELKDTGVELSENVNNLLKEAIRKDNLSKH